MEEEKKETTVEEPKEANLEEKKVEGKEEIPKKKGKPFIMGVFIALAVVIVVCLGGLIFLNGDSQNKDKKTTKTTEKAKKYLSEYRLSGNSLEDFDLYFLQLENNPKNTVYSPLSIKYALGMLADGAKGDTKEQIEAVLGDYTPRSYPNNEHMSFANAMFIKNTYQEDVKVSYLDTLKNKYNAEVIYDSFETPDTINNWVSDRTFKLINNLVDDASNNDFFLVNALAIDMEWNYQVHCIWDRNRKVDCLDNGRYGVEYLHEKLPDLPFGLHGYTAHDNPYTSVEQFYDNHEFNGVDNIKGADILADFNRYDIIKELGEEKIRETIRNDIAEKRQSSDDNMKEVLPTDVEGFLDKYIEEIKANYGKGDNSTDFLVYDDESVKSFAKDLKEYDGMTLQYVGIMPKNEDLATFIKESNANSINKIINNLKEVKIDSFEEGYATRIRGYIPFFDYDYQLDLMKDLQKMGIENIFGADADLSNMVEGPAFINKTIHKADIEFSNDGIKAAAATAVGGVGSTYGPAYDYLFEIPTINIDISFNKPYMYVIRDKATGEVWFAGTVYEPIHK